MPGVHHPSGLRTTTRVAFLAMALVLAGAWLLARADLSHAAVGPRPFAGSSVWNAPLRASAPLDKSSGRLVARLNALVKADQARRAGPWINTDEYSSPVYTVPADEPTVRVELDKDEPALQAAFNAVPIPANARPAAGTDKHMVIWQPARDRMWEFWLAERRPDGWHASWGGAMKDVSTNPGHFTRDSWPGAKTYWGATATSLPLLGGLIRISELRAGRIDHALAVSLPEVRAGQYSLPAQRTDGAAWGRSTIPEGARFRLDPKLNLDKLNLPPLTHMLAQAAQRYGMIVRDYSGVVAFVAEDPTPTGANLYPGAAGSLIPDWPQNLLAHFPWKKLRALRMELRRSPNSSRSARRTS